ncbi:MAG: hypothetical protein SYC29_05005 [Planctomycetota bacterium]|nr:hypothetical protein [Planctomycetota bacterium]
MKMLLMTAAALFVAGSAFAGSYDFNGYATGPYNDTVFGTNGTLGNMDNGLQHTWGTVSTYEDDYYAGYTYWMQVETSDMSIELRFYGTHEGTSFNFDPDWYDVIEMDFLGINAEFGGSISDVTTTYGTVDTDGSSIFWMSDPDGTDGLNYEYVTIDFVPAPGALALLGLAGLARRRRR